MLEYVFFNQIPFQQFLSFVQEKSIPHEQGGDQEMPLVLVPEDLDDDLSEQLEDFYEQMMALNQSLFDQDHPDGGDFQAAGVVVSLDNGKTVYADVDSGLLARVMSVITPEELGQLVDSIVDAVEHPDSRPLCKRNDAD